MSPLQHTARRELLDVGLFRSCHGVAIAHARGELRLRGPLLHDITLTPYITGRDAGLVLGARF